MAGTNWNIEDQPGTIVILAGNGLNYKFYAQDASDPNNLGVINNITIAPGATGNFTLLIDHQTPGLPGAKDWRAGDLRHAGGLCTITGINVARFLLSTGTPPALTHGDIRCQAINGNVTVGGSLGGDANATLKVFHADSVVGNVTLGSPNGGAFADLDFASFQGNLTIGNTPFGARTIGDITIGGSYGGLINLTDPDGYVGRIHIVGGDFTGGIFVTGPYYGQFEIDGDMEVPGRIEFAKWIDRSASGSNPPNIHVHGSLTNPNGFATTLPMIQVGMDVPDGGLRGTIAIDGDMTNAVYTNPNNPGEPEIRVWTIQSGNGSYGGIAIDYDGWDSGDHWPSGRIEEWRGNMLYDTYTGNEPAASIFLIQPCKGDANNDGVVTAADADFINEARLMYIDPPRNYCYVDHFSGLEGSVLWHADMNLNGTVDCRDAEIARRLVALYPNCCITSGTPVACLADFDQSGIVDIQDLANFVPHFGYCQGGIGYDEQLNIYYDGCDAVPTCSVSTDIDDSHCIGLEDFSLFLSVFGLPCPCSAGGSGYAGSASDSGSADEAEFAAWVRQATPEEVLEWYARWREENSDR